MPPVAVGRVVCCTADGRAGEQVEPPADVRAAMRVASVLLVLVLPSLARAEDGEPDRAPFENKPTAISVLAGSASPEP